MGLERHAGRLWVASTGGPLVAIEAARLVAWGGLENNDYERASACTGSVERIAVDGGTALVLGDEPAMTAVVARHDGLVFVRWLAADDEAAVERAIVALADADDVDATPSGLVFSWHGPEVVVFDSVETGAEQTRFDLPTGKELGDGAVRAPLSSGRYAVRLGRLDPAVGSLALVQLLRVMG
jgi:hypothetical protein